MSQTINFSNTTPAAPANAVLTGYQNDSSNPPNISSYVNSGVGGCPNVVARSLLTAQGAAITATTLLAIPSSGAGFYRITYVATITRAATTSCVLGGTNGFQIKFTNANGDSVVKTSNPTTVNSSATNATGTTISGTVSGFAAASTNLQYLFDYTSSGGTSMQYDLAIYVEFIGA